ncbi:MAG: biotin/lipoyl-binding protein, partial [Rhodospirillaceae bacterium]|nr:biotin/lipoyl-binding protein [Rhodospirillaceae bacterium]
MINKNTRFKHIVGFIGLAAFAAFSLTTIDTAHSQGQGMSQDQRRAIIQSLSDDERQKFFGMSQEEKQKFFQQKANAGKNTGGKSGGKASAGRPGGGRGGPGGRRRGGRPPTLVELGDVVQEPLVQTFPITGRLIASQKSAIAARIKGSVRKMLVEVGDRVKQGQIVAELDVDRLKLEATLRSADVLQARAKWKSSQAQVDLLNQELKRIQRLRKSAAFSQARFEDKKQEVVKASSAV